MVATSCGFESHHRHHVGAKSALLRRLFMPMAKKTSSARSLAPPFQIEPAALGFDLVLGRNPGALASIVLGCSTSEQSPLCSDVFLCLWQKRRHPPAPLLLLSKSNPLRWASIWFWAETWRHWHLYCCDISSPYSVRSTDFLFFSVPAEPAASWRRMRVQSAAAGRAGGTPALPLVRIQSLGPCGVSFGILRFLF